MWSTVYVRKYVWCENIVDADIIILFTANGRPDIVGDVLPEIKRIGQVAYLNCSAINLAPPAEVSHTLGKVPTLTGCLYMCIFVSLPIQSLEFKRHVSSLVSEGERWLCVFLILLGFA